MERCETWVEIQNRATNKLIELFLSNPYHEFTVEEIQDHLKKNGIELTESKTIDVICNLIDSYIVQIVNKNGHDIYKLDITNPLVEYFIKRTHEDEPLKNKAKLIKTLGGLKRTDGSELKMWFLNRGFLAKDVESAVSGLLKDIEKLKSEITDEYKNEWLNTAMKHYCISLLNECKGLVKKWFPDAFKEEKDEV
ncbi:MAG: hypothetical protein DRH06_00470 [Deltaproteobacteria bacterium]|nr:MAG: hypothetical protein DRH06_00470 [Deltaproteobacteria bacterium]